MARLNPLTKLFLVLLFSIGIALPGGLYPLLGILLMTIVSLLSRVNLPRALWKMKAMLITALLILVFSRLSGESWPTGIGKTCAFLAIISASLIYIKTTDLTELSSSMGRFLSPLLGRLSWKFASSVMMTIALFPMILTAAEEMVNARSSRGGSFLAHPFRNLTEYTVSLMRILFQKILIFQDALYSRFYSDTVERTSPGYSGKDYLMLSLSLIAFIGEVLWINLK